LSNQIQKLTDSHETETAAALLAIISQAQTQIDVRQVAAVLEHADDAGHITDHELSQLNAILGLDQGQLEALADAFGDDKGKALLTALAGLFVAVAALATAPLGYTLNGNAVREPRDATVAAFRDQFLADSTAAIIATARNMLTAAGSALARAKHIVRSIGLTANQANSLTAIRKALFQYLADPRNSDPAAIIKPLRGALSAPQRAMLRKAITGGANRSDVETLLDRHAKALRTYRAKVVAGDQLHQIGESAKLAGWQVAQRFGFLPKHQRRYWRTAGDDRVRVAHIATAAMNSAGVALNRPFHTPFGDRFAPPLEVNCRCRAVLK
jgi:hypothetical protein